MLPKIDEVIYFDEIFGEFYEHCAEWYNYPGWVNSDGVAGYRKVTPKVGDFIDYCHKGSGRKTKIARMTEETHRDKVLSRLPDGLGLDDTGMVIE